MELWNDHFSENGVLVQVLNNQEWYILPELHQLYSKSAEIISAVKSLEQASGSQIFNDDLTNRRNGTGWPFSEREKASANYDEQEEGQEPTAEYNRVYKTEGSGNESKQGVEHIESILKLIDDTKKIAEAFGKLPPEMQKLSEGLEMLGNMDKGAEGLGQLLSAGNVGLSIGEGVGTIAEVGAGAMGIAAAGSAFGPPGWIVAALAVAYTGIKVAIERKAEREEKTKREEEQTRQSLATFELPENVAANYMQHIQQEANKPLHKWQAPFNPAKENFRKYGPDAYSLNWAIPTAVKDGVSYARNIPPDIAKQKEPVIPVKRSYLQQTFGLQQRLKYAGLTGGSKAFDTIAIKALREAKIFDVKNHGDTYSMTYSAIKEAVASVFDSANEGRMVTNEDSVESGYGKRSRTAHQGNMGNRVININLNKPMIENFVINTKTPDEGINDLKHKVEVVLLELLNSANTIQ